MRPLLGPAQGIDPASEELAAAAWASPTVRASRVVIPTLTAVLGGACVAVANDAALRGTAGTQPLWWFGIMAIFAPAAVAILLARLSRTESVWVLVVTSVALYVVKLVFAPGAFWMFDELLHYPTVDSILRSGRLFAPNALLPVSPYYPGLEAVTAPLVQLTGLDIVNAGLVLIGVAHLLIVLALFLFIERIATPSRLAAPAALFYLACPAFLYFDAQYAYESLALPLSLACLFVLREAQLNQGVRRRRLNLAGALLLLAVIVTHHVTSFVLVLALLVWTAFDLYFVLRERARLGQGLWFDSETDEPLVYVVDLPGSGWVPTLGVVASAVWLAGVASITSNYLFPQVFAGIAELIRVILSGELGRSLFQSNGGLRASRLEVVVGIGSVLVILALIPLGIRYAWNQLKNRPLARLLAVGTVLYPVTLALRLTRGGWEVGSRATAFVYVPLAFALAAAIALLASRPDKRTIRSIAIALTAWLIFAGGVIAVTSSLTRQPSPYDPGRSWAPYDTESLAAADWAATTLGEGHRIVGDSAGGTLMGSFGRQVLVPSDDRFSLSDFFLSPTFDDRHEEMVRNTEIDYAFVDRRIAGTAPLKGFIYEKWERDVQGYGSSVSSETVNKFSVLREANRVFDSGNIQFFELHRLVP